MMESDIIQGQYGEPEEHADARQRRQRRVVGLLVAVLFGTTFLGSIIGFAIVGVPSTSMVTVLPFCALSGFLLLGVFLRANFIIFKKLFIPSSVCGGFAALLFIQLYSLFNKDSEVLASIVAGWSRLPSFTINIVFAVLFLGETIPPLRTVWDLSGVQFVYGQLLGWGQYCVGMLVGTLLAYAFNQNHAFGCIIPIGFEGGHGTAVGLDDSFATIGWEDGTEYALASATFGLLSGLVSGILLVNWYKRMKAPLDADPNGDGLVPLPQAPDNPLHERLMPRHSDSGAATTTKVALDPSVVFIPQEQQHSGSRVVISPHIVDSFAFHLCVIAMAVGFGYGLKSLLECFDEPLKSMVGVDRFFRTFPLFPLCMLGGILMQTILQRTDQMDKVDRATMMRLSSTSLDFLVVSAIATMKITTLSAGLVPFLLAMVCGIAFQLGMLLFVAPKFFTDFWFERAIAELGQSMGVTATGILLLHLADENDETPVMAAFAYKQLLHEPIMGGGLWTSMVLPLIYHIGPWPIFGIAVFAVCVHLLVWACYLRPKQQALSTVTRIAEMESFSPENW